MEEDYIKKHIKRLEKSFKVAEKHGNSVAMLEISRELFKLKG